MMLFAFVETSYSESDVKQVDVSFLVLGFGVLRYHALCTLAILQQGPPAMHDEFGAHRYFGKYLYFL